MNEKEQAVVDAFNAFNIRIQNLEKVINSHTATILAQQAELEKLWKRLNSAEGMVYGVSR